MNTTASQRTRPVIRIAVYGTLKRGHWNHETYCTGAVSIEEVLVRGRLYELPSGIPILCVPAEDVLAEGTTDPVADVVTQERLGRTLAGTPGGGWDWVHCELMTFDDPESRIAFIDGLEGFRPGRAGLYRRVLVPAIRGAEAISAWCYVAEEALICDLTPTGKTSWP